MDCDVCEGEGYELDDDGSPVPCHLCQGSGTLDWEDGEDADDMGGMDD